MSGLINQWQDRFVAIRNNKAFELVSIFVIIFSALVIGAKTFPVGSGYDLMLNILDSAITLFFLLEIIVRIVAERSLKRFFSQGWNLFDFIIVAISLIPTAQADLALVARLLRIFRVLRLVSIIPELRILITALFRALPRMGYVALLMFIIFYIYAAIGSFMFESINPGLWGNIAISLLTLFRVATFEDWTDVMYETMEVYPLSWVFYITFIFLTAFVFLNMMIGIVVDVLQEEHARHNRETGEGGEGEIHAIWEQNQELNERLERMETILQELKAQKS
uniref:Putative voltage-gated ion channel (VIC) superfamily protein n=1 Tax=Magnetococcus massalia (strain MO-1) TaxID=451514 RepID=A0A1S7LKD8_MAGMO|nr:putative voltage-gated ion channel (VIC) superfamily protein [Candidatus Magnetococcus massalia]